MLYAKELLYIFSCSHVHSHHFQSGILKVLILQNVCPFGWGCRIHQLLLCRRVRPHPPNECPGYDTKQSDGEVPVMLEL